MTPRMVSVAICTWNRCESLRRTLDAMTALRIPAGVAWELIVVNNNGTDDTDAVTLSFEGRLPIRLVHERTAGLSHARNRAIEVAQGEIVVWTDDDVLVAPEWLEGLLRGFERFDADVVFGPSKAAWEKGTAPAWFSPLHYGKLALIDYGPEAFVLPDQSTPFFGLNFAIKLDVLNRIGRFREDLGVKEDSGGGEDIDLFQRVHAAGHRVVYVPDAVVEHVIPPARMTRAFHRQKLTAGLPMYYRILQDRYARQPWLLGVPRFLYRKLGGDLVGYLRSAISGDRPARFHYELQILKFIGVYRQSQAVRKTGRAAQVPRVRGHKA